MKTLPLLCILACSWAKGEIPSEPSVVMQSVMFGKKPGTETESNDDCRSYASYDDFNMILRKIMHGMCHPPTTRYKRNDDSSYPDVEGFDDKTIEMLLEALEELKQDAEKTSEDVKDTDENARKTRLDQVLRRGGKWHSKIEECQAKRRKGEMETYKKMLKDNLEEFLAENKDVEKRLKKLNYRKKDWKDEMDRRRLKENLAESWPRMTEERLPEELYFPMPLHHQASHQKAYPTGGYLS